MARSELLWLDSDIILDWMASREPWDADATALIDRAILGHWQLCFSPLTLANVHYIYRKQAGSSKALAAIRTLVQMGKVATMEAAHVIAALAAAHSDFEDQIQIASAADVPDLTAIITRNVTDYAKSPVPAMTAGDWLSQHPAS